MMTTERSVQERFAIRVLRSADCALRSTDGELLRKERCPGSREREYLQAMHYRGRVSVTPRILHVVVNRMIVSRNGLEGRGMRIGECAAWCAEDFANA